MRVRGVEGSVSARHGKVTLEPGVTMTASGGPATIRVATVNGKVKG